MTFSIFEMCLALAHCLLRGLSLDPYSGEVSRPLHRPLTDWRPRSCNAQPCETYNSLVARPRVPCNPKFAEGCASQVDAGYKGLYPLQPSPAWLVQPPSWPGLCNPLQLSPARFAQPSATPRLQGTRGACNQGVADPRGLSFATPRLQETPARLKCLSWHPRRSGAPPYKYICTYMFV